MATAGSILLAVPLFHLLRAREGIEDLEIDLTQAIGEKRRTDIQTSLLDLRLHVRTNRNMAINIGLSGLILLLLALMLMILQGFKLYS